jgi:hypothetical protein
MVFKFTESGGSSFLFESTPASGDGKAADEVFKGASPSGGKSM